MLLGFAVWLCCLGLVVGGAGLASGGSRGIGQDDTACCSKSCGLAYITKGRQEQRVSIGPFKVQTSTTTEITETGQEEFVVLILDR